MLGLWLPELLCFALQGMGGWGTLKTPLLCRFPPRHRRSLWQGEAANVSDDSIDSLKRDCIFLCIYSLSAFLLLHWI